MWDSNRPPLLKLSSVAYTKAPDAEEDCVAFPRATLTYPVGHMGTLQAEDEVAAPDEDVVHPVGHRVQLA
jgi:hypothetical protein